MGDPGGTGMQPPQLDPETRRLAVARASHARRRRAEIRGMLKDRTLTLRSLLDQTSEEVLANTKVSAMLEWMPGIGKVRARKIMERLDIAPSRRLRGLGSKQKQALLEEFDSPRAP